MEFELNDQFRKGDLTFVMVEEDQMGLNQVVPSRRRRLILYHVIFEIPIGTLREEFLSRVRIDC